MFTTWLFLMGLLLPFLLGFPLPLIFVSVMFLFFWIWKIKKQKILIILFLFLYSLLSFYILFPQPALLSQGYHKIVLTTTSFFKPEPNGDITLRSGPFFLNISRNILANRATNSNQALSLALGTTLLIQAQASAPMHNIQFLRVLDFKVFRPAPFPFEWLARVRSKLHHAFQSRVQHPEIAALLEGLILGNKQYLSYGVLKSFQITGIAHLLALSGLHVGIVSFLFLFLLTPIFGRKPALVVSALSVIFYMLLSGMSASILRAGLMFLIFSFLSLIGRSARWQDIVGGVGVFLILLNPGILTHAGYWLSFGAVTGIVAGFHFFKQGLSILPQPLKDWTALSFSAQWGTFLPQLLWFKSVSPISLIINPLIVPLFSLLSYGLFFYVFLIPLPLPDWFRFVLETPLFALWKLIDVISSSFALFGFLSWQTQDLSLWIKLLTGSLVMLWPPLWMRHPQWQTGGSKNYPNLKKSLL